MDSGRNVVLLVRICGSVLVVRRKANGRPDVRVVGAYSTKPPDQSGVLELLHRRIKSPGRRVP